MYHADFLLDLGYFAAIYMCSTVLLHPADGKPDQPLDWEQGDVRYLACLIGKVEQSCNLAQHI
jgi:hypothetical protein